MRLPRIFDRKTNPLWRSIVAFVGGSDVAWTPKDYRTLSIAGYQNCASVYACVKLIAQTASRIEWYVSRMDAKGDLNEFDRHALTDLLKRPNELQGGSLFTEQVLSHLLLAGNSYVLKVSGTPTQPPQFLYTMRPDRTEILPDKTGKFLVRGYRYTVAGQKKDFPSDEVMHLLEFHPTEDFYGLSRIEVAAKHIDVANLAAEWNAKLLTNDMRAPGVITARSLNTADLDRFKQMFKDNYQGSQNAGMPLIFAGEDVKWDTIALNPKDVDWLDGQKFTLRQICTIFGVNPCLIGDMEYSTLANMKEARRALYQEVILPLMDMLRDEYNRWLVPLYGQGLVLDYDRDGIEELQEDRGQQYAYLAQADWLTLNEKRVATGFDEIEGGDVILVPISNIPLEEATAEPEPVPDMGGESDDVGEPPAGQEPPPAKAASTKSARRVIKAVKKSFWTDPERKERLWTNFETRVKTREKSYQQIARAYLKRQRDDILAALKRAGTLAVEPTALFDIDAEVKRYEQDFKGWYRDHFLRAGNAGMRASKGELFNDAEFKADAPTSWVFTMTPKQEAALHEMIYKSGTKVNETTLDTISTQLYKAQTENLTVDEFSRNIADEVAEFDPWRARLWSRTESAKVDNFGMVEGYRETEFVDMKGWMCSNVPASRDAHIKADGDEVMVGEDFNIGGEMLAYPGDPRGSAGNVCNCLCSTYPVVGPESGVN
jgi:HK97 family phage portal protein